MVLVVPCLQTSVAINFLGSVLQEGGRGGCTECCTAIKQNFLKENSWGYAICSTGKLKSWETNEAEQKREKKSVQNTFIGLVNQLGLIAYKIIKK